MWGMKKAIKGVKTLTLRVSHRRIARRSPLVSPTPEQVLQHEQEQQQEKDDHDEQWQILHNGSSHSCKAFVMTCPAGLGVVAGGVFAMLATAVPKLQTLNLRGSCWDAALYAFGISCPLLHTLDVEVPHVPIEALRDFGKLLPNLVSVNVGSRDIQDLDDPVITSWMDTFLPTTQHCLKLASLVIDFSEGSELSCQPDVWKHLPAGLKHLQCGVDMIWSDAFHELIRRVPSIVLEIFPVRNLTQLFQQFPLLERLEVFDYSNYAWLECGDDSDSDIDDSDDDEDEGDTGTPAGRALLKERFVKGLFSLVCFRMGFSGTSEEVQEVFTWFPVIPGIGHVQLMCAGDTTPDYLKSLPRLFPEAYRVVLSGPAVEGGGGGGWGMDVLQPLAAMPSMTHLELRCPQLVLTVPGLVQLCRNLTHLKHLDLSKGLCEGLDRDEVKLAIDALERGIKLFFSSGYNVDGMLLV